MRRISIPIKVGKLTIGGDAPIAVQSMCNINTNDIDACVEQTIKVVNAGGELMRFTTQGLKEVESLAEIKRQLVAKGYNIPIVADVHFNPKVAEAAAAVVDKVRINPGNFVAGKDEEYTDDEYKAELIEVEGKIKTLINICKEHNTAIRIGVNHGSLSKRIMNRYGNSPEGLAQSCVEFVEICERLQFKNIILSIKASNPIIMVQAVRILSKRLDEIGLPYPIHLGVTEAGEGEDGRIKSAVGIGSLLIDGIGDTIRVSLSEEPEAEIPAAFNILQATRSRITKIDYISCPGCGRTLFDLQNTVSKVKAATSHLTGLKIAVMGCIVNGPGEMADADFGYVGAGKGKISLYKGKTCIEKNIPEELAVEKLLALIDRTN